MSAHRPLRNPAQPANTQIAHRNRQSSGREECTWDAKEVPLQSAVNSMKLRGLGFSRELQLAQSSHRETRASHASTHAVRSTCTELQAKLVGRGLGFGFCRQRFTLHRYVVPLQFAVQRRAADAEHLSGKGFVTVGLLE